jgi:isopenicillin N synthase-like dioxygenase
VVTPDAGRDRLSIAFFLGARHDATVPLLELPAALAEQASEKLSHAARASAMSRSA